MALPVSGQLSLHDIGHYKSIPSTQYGLGSNLAIGYYFTAGTQRAVSDFYGKT